MKKDKSGKSRACAFIQSHLLSVIEENTAGALSPDIQQHLGSCRECAFLVQQFARAWASPATPKQIQPSPSFLLDLIRRIEAEEEVSSGRKAIWTLAWRILRPAAVAAIFLGGIFAGHEMGKAGKPLPSPKEHFADRLVDSFENIPRGSVADFYVNRQNLSKEDLE
jgi:hypothetical protein